MSVPPYNYLFLLCTTLTASLPDGKMVDLTNGWSDAAAICCCLHIITVLTPRDMRELITGGTQEQQGTNS